jgi:hypothetical protein
MSISPEDLDLFSIGKPYVPPQEPPTWKIIAKHEDCDYFEEVDTADDAETAEHLVGEYQMAFGPQWTIDFIAPTV